MSQGSHRFMEIDALRGFAVLGIFQINIYFFGQPYEIYHYPTIFGAHDSLNAFAWLYTTLWVEGAMYGLFSLLFGASAMMLLSAGASTEAGHSSAHITVSSIDHYYRRMLWLCVLGGIHAYVLLSPMEVLYTYGVLGLVLFPLRNWKAQSLIALGTLLVFKGAFEFNLISNAAASLLPEAETNSAIASVIADLKLYQSGYWPIFLDNIGTAYIWQTELFYEDQLVDAGGMMLIGMGFYKLGILTGQKSLRFYLGMMLIGYLSTLILRGPNAIELIDSGFDGYVFNDQATEPMLIARLFLALGHIGLIMSLFKLQLAAGALRALAQTGQMALTHYVTQTLCAVTIFYGFGAGLFGKLERYEMLLLAIAIGLAQVAISVFWLRYYRQGPLEWLLRSLVKWQRQPFKSARADTPSMKMPAPL